MTLKKRTTYILNNQTLVNSYNFTNKVREELYNYVIMLADMEKLIPSQSLDKQLKLLKPLNADTQLKVVTETIEHGWLNLRYKVEEYTNSKKSESRSGKSVKQETVEEGEYY